MYVLQGEWTRRRTACGPDVLLKTVSRLSLAKRCSFYCVLLIGLTCADVGEESGVAGVEYTEVVHPQPAGWAPGERLYIYSLLSTCDLQDLGYFSPNLL